MKACGQKNQVTLLVHGRERTFSEQELIAILEEHIPSNSTKQAINEKIVQPPTEGKLFEVNPLGIDQTLFQEKRKDLRQEKTRQLILWAFDEVKSNPEKYGITFYTMMPKKTWSSKTVTELKKMACEMGDHNADWVEQALEWAQRIANGERWEDICNNRDTANWYRLVVWKNGYLRLIGGSRNFYDKLSPSEIIISNFFDIYIDYTVPLVVLYK